MFFDAMLSSNPATNTNQTNIKIIQSNSNVNNTNGNNSNGLSNSLNNSELLQLFNNHLQAQHQQQQQQQQQQVVNLNLPITIIDANHQIIRQNSSVNNMNSNT
jgi:hypothetical protein